MPDDPAAPARKSKQDNAKRTLRLLGKPAMWGLGILLAANVLLLATVFFQVWQEFGKPQVLVVHTVPDLETIFSMYKDRVDNLQKTITALVGLSSLYSIVLGFTAYFSVQQYLAQFGKAIKDAKKQTEELRRQTPILRGIDQSISHTIDLLDQRLPDRVYLFYTFERLTKHEREELLYYERAMAFLEFLDLEPKRKTLSELYRKLGKLCQARYEWEKKEKAQAEGLYSLMDRARLYANRSLKHNPDNFSTLTDLAIYLDLSHDEPRDDPFQKIKESLTKQPYQQRAYYQRGCFFLDRARTAEKRGDIVAAVSAYKACVQACSDALGQSDWETGPLPERRPDILYNRACARSRHARLEVGANRQNELGRDAWLDLNDACPDANQIFLEILNGDLDDSKDGDLTWLGSRQPEAIDALKRRLTGETLAVPIAVTWN